MTEEIIRKLITSLKCSSCGRNYSKHDAHVIEHFDQLWFLRVLCSSCHARSLVAAIIKEDRTEPFVDLTSAELSRFESLSPVDGNDLLDMHGFLGDFDGDFCGLFGMDRRREAGG